MVHMLLLNLGSKNKDIDLFKNCWKQRSGIPMLPEFLSKDYCDQKLSLAIDGIFAMFTPSGRSSVG